MLKKNIVRNSLGLVVGALVFAGAYYAFDLLMSWIQRQNGARQVFYDLFWLYALCDLLQVALAAGLSLLAAKWISAPNVKGTAVPVVLLGLLVAAAGVVLALLTGFQGAWIKNQFTNMMLVLAGIVLIFCSKKIERIRSREPGGPKKQIS